MEDTSVDHGEPISIDASAPVAPPPPAPTKVVDNGEKEARSGMLDGIQSFARDSLKPTTTVVYGTPIVSQSCGRNNVTGAPTAEEVIEYFDSEEELQRKAVEFAHILQGAKHFVVYTGAGISTAAKIPDYRGPQGVWTLQAKGMAAKMPITLEQALPTYSHMALVALMKKGILKFVVSTNVDGLHRRSGIPEECISELHGNVYREVCGNEECGKEYLRPFDVTKNRRQRFTGRLCNSCGSRLVDSIINFGENLPKRALSRAEEHSSLADVTLVIGSSMRVQPACFLPERSYKKGGSFTICNIQKTHFDKYTQRGGLRVFSRSDDFMRRVMEELGIEVEEFKGEEDTQIAAQMQEMLFDETFHSIPHHLVKSMADDPIPKEVLDQILAGMFNLRRVDVVQPASPVHK